MNLTDEKDALGKLLNYLMKVGIHAFTTNQAFSRVIELTAE